MTDLELMQMSAYLSGGGHHHHHGGGGTTFVPMYVPQPEGNAPTVIVDSGSTRELYELKAYLNEILRLNPGLKMPKK